MPPKSSREQQKRRTRERLVDAAAAVFSERGYGAATLDDIADRAGLTKGAVYSNFENKTDLVLAVLNRRIDEPQLEIFDHVDPAEDLSDRFAHASKLLAEGFDTAWFRLELECTVDALSDHRSLSKVQARDDAARSRLIKALGERQTIPNAMSNEDLETMATALIAVVNGAALQRLKDPTRMPDELIARLLAIVTTGWSGT
jgi:AcrR family transcriptional regulator